MGLLDRLHKIATGVGGALQAPFGLAKDLATAPWNDGDEFDGLVNTVFRRTVARGGQVFGNLIGPDEGVGAVVGGLPEGLRSPVRAVTGPVLEGVETVYREGISEPITTALTVGSLADAPGGGGLPGLLNPRHWREGHRIAQDRSPGQALALAVGTEDITDEAEVARYSATDSYDIVSGVADAVLRLRADPTILAGKGATAARTRVGIRPLELVPDTIHTADDINRAMRSGRIERFVGALEGKTAAEIRHEFFPHHPHGAVISSVLEDAVQHGQTTSALRALMGDATELERIYEARASLAGRIERLTAERSELLQYADDSLFGDPRRTARLTAEVEDLYPEAQRIERQRAAFGTLTHTPRVTLGGRVRTSDFYQSSPLARPLHVVFDMRPQRLVNLHDTSGDVQLARMLRKSALDRTEQDSIRGAYMAALTPGERQHILERAEARAVRSMAEQAGMTVEEIESVLATAARGRGRAMEVLRSRAYDGQGRSIVRWEEDGVWQEMHVPLWATQEANVLPLVDLDEVRRATTSIGRFRARHPSTDIPTELLERFHKVWVRHEAPCSRGRVRDPPHRTVAAVR